MTYELVSFFSDPVLRAPTIGSILMCVSSSLVGVLVLLRKRSLIGEALSHASYPGIALGVSLFATVFPPSSDGFVFVILLFAFISSVVGLFFIDFLKKRFHVYDDSSLTLVLSSFFGMGVLFASRLQTTHAVWYKQVQTFLYGQAATMRDIHVWIYLWLLVGILLALVFFFRKIQMWIFDEDFMKSIGVRSKTIDLLLVILTCLAVVVGIRSVGVVMMAGMLIAPALAARALSRSLKEMLIFSALLGGISGFLGNYLSLAIPDLVSCAKIILPTGPMILIVASILCFSILMFSPSKGVFWKKIKTRILKYCIVRDQLLVLIGRDLSESTTFSELKLHLQYSYVKILIILCLEKMRKNIIFHHDKILLTDLGKKQAVEIMRLNRLWKIYLMDFESSARTDFSFESPSRLSPEAVLVLKQLESKKTSIDVIDPRSIDHTKY